MSEVQIPETPHERRVTWGLMAAVVAFVLVMSCIVLWVTTSLIREERGAASPVKTLNPTDTQRPALPAVTVTAPPTSAPTKQLETGAGPVLVDATWTAVPGPKRYVRFVTWKVKPNKIAVGECVQLTWATEFAAELKLYRDGELFVDRAPAATTLQDCPTQLGYVVYRLVGWNHAGESNWVQLQVKVLAAP
jgi:hypothetical protein